MKRLLLKLPLLLCLLSFLPSKGQIIIIPTNGNANSVNAGFGSSSYAANECIYSETEIGPNNFTTPGSAILQIAYPPYTVPAGGSTYNNVSIYMRDVPFADSVFTGSAPLSTSGYTLVFSGSVTFSGTGYTDINLTTPYVRTPGTHLGVLITRADGVAHTGMSFLCAQGILANYTLASTRRYNNTAALSGSTTLATSNFRQAIRLKHQYPNDAAVSNIYSLGKLPIPNAESQVISANITNNGLNTLTNLDVTLTISGANSFTNTQNIPTLAPGASAVVTFPAALMTVTGLNNVSVTLPLDDYNDDNEKILVQTVNANTWSYAYGPDPAGGVGFNAPNFGDFVARFNTNATTYITQVSVNFTNAGQPFKIGIWDASGAGGTPGTLIWESPGQTSVAGVYVMPVLPAVLLGAGDFFVGVRQTSTTNNVGFAYQTENPIRPNTFYYASNGSTNWLDFAPVSPFRFMIEPKLILGTDASLSNVILNSGGTSSCANATQTASVVITNTGANTIAPGTATVTMKVAGDNTFTTTATNSTGIVFGGTETVSLTGLPAFNAGTNLDTLFVTVLGDQEPDNDTAKIAQQILPVIGTFPEIQSYENAAPYSINNHTQLAGTGLWAVQLIPAKNPDLLDSLRPHSGRRFILFDSYNFATATSARIYSNCLELPSASSGTTCNNTALGFFLSHDNSFPANPDSLYVTISTDGGATWNRVLPGYGRYDATFTLPGWRRENVDLSSYAGQTIQIGFEAVGKFGNIIAIDDIMVGSQALQNVSLSSSLSNSISLQFSCDDAGWTYYANPALPNENVIAINWDPGNTGANAAARAVAIPTLQLDPSYYSAENTANQTATYTMARYWNVDLGSASLTSPVSLRFFYDSTEINAVTTAVNSFITANGGTAEAPTWFKTNGVPFTPNSTTIDDQGVFNAIALTNSNTTNARINGIPYAQFDGITSFSGGTYAAGVGLATPLPIELFDISAKNLGNRNLIGWSSDKANIASYTVQKSDNGYIFEDLETVSPNSRHTYSVYDQSPRNGTNYYRIGLSDQAGGVSYSRIVIVANTLNDEISLYPNPAKDKFNISLRSSQSGNAAVTVLDITGKVVATHYRSLKQGMNVVTMPVQGWAKGAYMLRLTTDDATYYSRIDIQ